MRVRLEPSPDVEGSWVVADVAIAYGGVAPKSIMATQVCRHLTPEHQA
jgi:hypothetical protein